MYTNIDLLPNNGTTVIKGIDQRIKYLNLMKYFIEDLYIAIYQFKTGQLYKFDAQVGETLCQIRAYKILTLHENKIVFAEKVLTNFEKKIYIIYEKINKLIKLYENINFKQITKEPNQEKLIDFFNQKGIQINIPEDIFFIYLSYFLDYFKFNNDEGYPISIDYVKISKTLHTSKTYSKKIAINLQKILSNLSCNFIISLIDEIPEKKPLKAIFSFLKLESDENRNVLPCYLVTDIIINHIILKKRKILLLIKNANNEKKHNVLILARGNPKINDFSAIIDPDGKIDYGKEGFLVIVAHSFTQNASSFSNNLKKFGIRNVIMLNAATHPQYSGDRLNYLSSNPFEHFSNKQIKNSGANLKLITHLENDFKSMKRIAESNGCLLENQSTFFIKHIFCDTLKRYIGILNNPIPEKSLGEAAYT